MSWSFENGIWNCSSYSDLTPAAINNLAESGQPMKQGESGFISNLAVDFGNIVVQMPQSEVMMNGYGRMISPDGFPIVTRFLREPLPADLPQVCDFPTLVQRGFARTGDRFIGRSLYGDPTAISDQYVHGTVGFALMAGSRFFRDQGGCRSVDAEIGALDDNWDFVSSNPLVNSLNPLVEFFKGPAVNNLKSAIEIRFRGPGKRMRSEVCPILPQRPDAKPRQPNIR